MSEPVTYLGKPLSSYNVWELGHILSSMNTAEAKRNEARQHEKFKKLDGKGMEFPPPNPAFLKLKSAIEEEITSRK